MGPQQNGEDQEQNDTPKSQISKINIIKKKEISNELDEPMIGNKNDENSSNMNDQSSDSENYDAYGENDNFQNKEFKIKKFKVTSLVDDWKKLFKLDSYPLMQSGYSIESDMKFGWKPQIKGKVLPIPLVFDLEDNYFDLEHYLDQKDVNNKSNTIYYGWRPTDSIKMYQRLLQNKDGFTSTQINFKLPGNLPGFVKRILDIQQEQNVLGYNRTEEERNGMKRRVCGMIPDYLKQYNEVGDILSFDAAFESGNLDRVVMVSNNEYDLYMRQDTNAKGHHQWFYFKVSSKKPLGPVKFNVINFTKNRSLYENGMQVCVCSITEKNQLIQKQEQKGIKLSFQELEKIGWKRGCYDIKYEQSKLNQVIENNFYIKNKKKKSKITEKLNNFSALGTQGGILQDQGDSEDETDQPNFPQFFQVSFTYDFMNETEDETYFAYSFPYSFTRLQKYLNNLKEQKDSGQESCLKDCTPLCQSLSGVNVPYLIVTTRANSPDYNLISKNEHQEQNLPDYTKKKHIVLTGRVHPGETNSSYMMEGFIDFITSSKEPIAIELRKRIVFHIIPCINPDGVISGNYRVSMSGNDLNRRYVKPHQKLHPIVCAIKKLIKDLSEIQPIQEDIQKSNQDNNNCVQLENKSLIAYIDMHGHSRKKNVFMYGPSYPIHDLRYLKIRVLPKLMSEQSEMFRFYACKFRIQKSKEKTARVVLWREFNILNCFTLEASFQGYFDSERLTHCFTQNNFLQVGVQLANSLFELLVITEDEDRIQKEAKLKRDLAKRKQKGKNNSKVKQDQLKDNDLQQSSRKNNQDEFKKTKKESKENDEDSETSKQNNGILSHSGSSENLEDDLDSKELSEVKKINKIRKKLLMSQKKQAKELDDENQGIQDTPGMKKKVNLISQKQFKDDEIKSLNTQMNPNEPPEDDMKKQSNLFDQVRFKKRGLQEVCNEIKNEEDIKQEYKQSKKEGKSLKLEKFKKFEELDEENLIFTSDNLTDHKNDVYGSDDDDQILNKIHGNILGVLNCEDKTPKKNSASKPKKNDQKKEKKTSKKKQEKKPPLSEKKTVQKFPIEIIKKEQVQSKPTLTKPIQEAYTTQTQIRQIAKEQNQLFQTQPLFAFQTNSLNFVNP